MVLMKCVSYRYMNVLCIFSNLIVVYLYNCMHTEKECMQNGFLLKMNYKYLSHNIIVVLFSQWLKPYESVYICIFTTKCEH